MYSLTLEYVYVLEYNTNFLYFQSLLGKHAHFSSVGKMHFSKKGNVTFSYYSRPNLRHPIRLLPHAKLTIHFNLRVTNHITLLPFFQTLNPRFKVYVGDTLFFDYLTSMAKSENSVSIFSFDSL